MDIDPQSVKAGFDAVKSAIDVLKGVRETLRSKPDTNSQIDEQIKLAERQVALGEAQIAQALGYKLCKAHFPPVAMLKDRIHPKYVEEIAKCPICSREDPSSEYFAEKERSDQMMRDYNSRLGGGDGW